MSRCIPHLNSGGCLPFCRYLNTDYAFASAISRNLEAGIPHVVVTYDIACQWGINLRERLSEYTTTKNVNLDSLRSLRFAVPKLHLVGHGKPCYLNYNLAFMRGVGMTHGENVETIWSHSTSLATWSRENGPQARHTLLDSHWSGWNWRKLVNLRVSFLRPLCLVSLIFAFSTGRQLKQNLEGAWKFAKVQGNNVTTLNNALDPTVVNTWTAMMDAYYLDPSKPNPFKERAPSKLLRSAPPPPRAEYRIRC